MLQGCRSSDAEVMVSISEQGAIVATQRWLNTVVIDLKLCPFARSPVEAGTLCYRVEPTDEATVLLAALDTLLDDLSGNERYETALLIHPNVLEDFYAYNDFLNRCDALLGRKSLRGVFQIASFHPRYQFADAEPDAAENYTNRSPYPMLHVLRETSVEQAVSTHPNVNSIPAANISLLSAMGAAAISQRLRNCYSDER